MVKDCLKVRLYSDSLGLPRGNEIDQSQRYISILLKYWAESDFRKIELLDRSRANFNIIDLYQWFVEDNKYFLPECDIIIIQEGVVDCAPRPIPKRIRIIIDKLPVFFKRGIISFLHNNRSKLHKLGFKYYYVNPQEFYKKYVEFLTAASRVAKKIYVFNIAPTNIKTELHSPGFSKSITHYNSLIAEVVNKLSENNNIYLIDVYSKILQMGNDLDKYINREDGHHITIFGHLLYAELIQEAELESRNGTVS